METKEYIFKENWYVTAWGTRDSRYFQEDQNFRKEFPTKEKAVDFYNQAKAKAKDNKWEYWAVEILHRIPQLDGDFEFYNCFKFDKYYRGGKGQIKYP